MTYSQSVSPSSSSSLSAEVDQDIDTTDREPTTIQRHDGYQYYPGTIYDGFTDGEHKAAQGPTYTLAPAKQDSHPVTFSDSWHLAQCTRFEGYGTSQGHYTEGQPGP
jgi:hypothetical protein